MGVKKINYSTEFENILKNESITTLFQPIISLKNGEVIGYESLSRGPKNSNFYSPLSLIKIAEEENKLWELELLFRKKAIEKAYSLDKNKLLFINVDPNIIKNSKFEKEFTSCYLEKYNISPQSIIFEITERTAIEDYKKFSSILKNYTDKGYRIAIDDTGSGYSGLKTILEIKPNYIKLDIDLIKNINKDSFKQDIVKSLVSLSESTNIKLIAEGIELQEELECLVKLGVHAGQGYFLQRPVGAFLDISEHVKNIILKFNQLSHDIFKYSSEYHYIGSIMESIPAFNSLTCCKEIQEHLDNTDYEGICIVEDNFPIGLVMKNNLFSIFAKQYGYSLYSKKPVSNIMDESPLIVDYYTPINVVSELAMERKKENIYDNIIVTQGSKYCGILSIKKLLNYTITFEKNYARELNPLTSLPGNVIIKRVLSDSISYINKSSCVLYFDLNNFKVYNDVYGFQNGDKVIKLIGEIINYTVKSMFPLNSFVGHIGGDDFICVIDAPYEDCAYICKKIILQFDEQVMNFFSEIDKSNKFIESLDRSGILSKFPLTSLSISGIYGNLSFFQNSDILAKYASNLKKQVKQKTTSSYIVQKI